MIKKYFLAFGIGLVFLSSLYAQTQKNEKPPMQIRIISGSKTTIATLNNSQAARDFLTMLPLTLTLSDYGQNEKVSDLPRKLSTTGSPAGYIPNIGDIAYYAPWGNLAIFRRNFSYSNGLIKLGQIENGIEALDTSGSIQVLIEVVTDE